DALSVYGSPSYYAIQIFSRNLGNQILPTVSPDTSLQACATRDSKTGKIFLKIVNPETNAASAKIEIQGVASLSKEASALTLAGNPEDLNSLNQPRNVVPVETNFHPDSPSFSYTLPAHSIVVLKLKAR